MWYTDTQTFDGVTFDFQIYAPATRNPDILFVHHGDSRSLYTSGSATIAEREGFAIFSPIYPNADYDSDAYQRGGIVDDNDHVLPEDEWTTRFESQMVDWALSEVGGDANVYLFGHSAGGQFLSRVAAYERPLNVDRFVIANPSTWVLPSLEEDAPYGFDGLGTDAEERQALEEYLALPITIYLGSEDDDPSDPSLSTGSAAMRQGDTRLERGTNTFEMGRSVAEANGWDFNWELVIAEGVHHSGSSMLRAPEMSEALAPVPVPVPVPVPANAVPYDLVLDGAWVEEDAEVGTVIGRLSATDPDGDVLTYSVSGDSRFTVNGAQLIVAPGVDLSGDGDRQVVLTLRAVDGRGGVAETKAAVTIADVSDPVTQPSADPIGEAGCVTFTQTDAGQWHRVSFMEALENASVVMGGLTFEGQHAGTLRVRNVSETGFEFQLDEWDYLDGRHATETVSWMAVERGIHTLSNGLVIEADSATASGNRSRVAFDADLGAAPVVLAQVASTNDAHAVVERLHDVNRTGFSVQLDRQESQRKATHGGESLDWIALAADGSAGAGAGLVSGRTGDIVSHVVHKVSFGNVFSSDSFAFLADMQTRDGSDPSDLRIFGSNRTGASLFVHEEQSRDREIGHTTEDVGFIGIDTGLIYADPFFG